VKKSIFTFCCFILSFSGAQAIPVKKTNFAELFAHASSVVGAQVIEVDPSAKTARVYGYPADGLSVFEARLRIGAVYKGNPPASGISVCFLRVPADPGVFIDLKVGSAYLLFLQNAEPVSLLSDVQNGAFQVDPLALRETAAFPSNRIEALFQRSSTSPNIEVVVKALQALAFVGTSNSLPVVEGLVSSTNDEVRLAAATAAVRLGDWKRIEDIVTFWEGRSYGNDGYIGFPDHNLASTSWATVGEVSAKEASPVVSRMLHQAKSTRIKRTLIQTLLSINDPQGVSAVAPFIEDADSRVAYEAYVTVMKLRGRPCVTPELFERDKAAIKDEIRKGCPQVK